MDVKGETIEMLRKMKRNAHSDMLGKNTLIDKVSLEDFLWTINQAISMIKDGQQDWRDN
jgi:hypothetical protein